MAEEIKEINPASNTETTVKEIHPQTPLQHYYGVCERKVEFGMFQEPLNVVTNVGFFIAAALIFSLYHKNKDYRGQKMWDVYFLNICMIFIGVASVTFHMNPNKYTEIADTAFIILFIIVYFTSAMVRITVLSKFQVTVAMMAFLFTTYFLVKNFPNTLNDSVAYLSSMAALIFIAVYLNVKRRSAAQAFMLASIIGMVSLFFRVIDREFCDQITTGTHFIWHTLNSVLLYILMKQLVRSINRRARMLKMAAEEGL